MATEQEILDRPRRDRERGRRRAGRRRAARQVVHRRPRHRLAVDGRGRRRRRGEVRRPDPRRRRQEPEDRRRRRRLHPAGRAEPDATVRAPRPDREGATDVGEQTDRTAVVVTGLGATTPLGGDVAHDLGGHAGRAVRRPRPDRGVGRRPAGADRRAGRRRPAARCWTGSRPASSTATEQFALVAAREAWADAGSPEVDPERLGVVVAHRHRRASDPARRRTTRCARRARAGVSAAHRPDADAERSGRRGRARARRAGRRAHAGLARAPSGAEADRVRRST